MSANLALVAVRMTATLSRLMLARYFIVSILALVGDTGLFLALDHGGIHPAWAACAAYLAGMMIHWMLSVRFVFGTALGAGGPTDFQRLTFLVSGMAGVAITVATVSVSTTLGVPAIAAKSGAIVISFITVYLVRRYAFLAR